MDKELLELIDEAIKLEMRVGELYGLFASHFKEDKSFWVQLELEEYNHAALLRAAKDFVSLSKFPEEMIPATVEQIRQSLKQLEESKKRFENEHNRFDAFSIAYEIENAAGELHYQQFMEKKSEDEISRIFKDLNKADSDHSRRVLDYWTKASQEGNQK
jgi:hypothetical protein